MVSCVRAGASSVCQHRVPKPWSRAQHMLRVEKIVLTSYLGSTELPAAPAHSPWVSTRQEGSRPHGSFLTNNFFVVFLIIKIIRRNLESTEKLKITISYNLTTLRIHLLTFLGISTRLLYLDTSMWYMCAYVHSVYSIRILFSNR